MDDIEFAYNQALDYLYSFVDYSLTRNLSYSPEKFDLGRMVELMNNLGNPQRDYPVIHIAGTKGKGSTAALIASALQAAGYRVGFYTSPHLQDFSERIQVNQGAISHSELVELVEWLKPEVAKTERLTTFELTTALAFMYFRQSKVDVAVVEVGLGGRLDATNIVTPLVSVITSLSMDHMAVLGDTLPKIAAEKAGIIKPGRPVVLAPQREEARKVIQDIAAERGSKLIDVRQNVHYAPWTHSLDGQTMLIWQVEDQAKADDFIENAGETPWQPLRLTLPLLGYHQVENAATAFVALRAVRENGFKISDKEIQAGFANVKWPGRFEILNREPLLIIDSAHNRDSALKLRITLDDYLAGLPIVLLFGASEDKDVAGMFAELMPRVSRVVATQSIHPRAMEPVKLVEMAHAYGRPAQVVLPVEAALSRALQIARQENMAVVAAGSLFIAAAVRDAWQNLVTR